MAIVLIPNHKPIPALYAHTHRLRHRGTRHTQWNAIIYRWPHRKPATGSIPYQLQEPGRATALLPKKIHGKPATYYYAYPWQHAYLIVRIHPRKPRREFDNAWPATAPHHDMIIGLTTVIHTTRRGTMIKIRGIYTHWRRHKKSNRWK